MDSKRHMERPLGMRDYVMDDMAHRSRVEQQVLAEFAAWGYRQLETPVLEYTDTVLQGIHRGEEDQLLRLFDSSGRTLALRPEMTTPVARIVARELTGVPMPLRLCYSAKTYRERGTRTQDPLEVTQTGIELIGEQSPDADAEVLALMAHVLHNLGVHSFRLAVGHMGFVQAMLQNIPPIAQADLRNALVRKDLVAYDALLAGMHDTVDRRLLQSLQDMPRIRGGEDALHRAHALALTADAHAACAELQDLWEALRAYGIVDTVHVDYGLVLDHEYYTGIIMEGFAEPIGRSICSGGRYDRLLAQFGRPEVATGCVLHLERLMTVVPSEEMGRKPIEIYYIDRERNAAITFAQRLRGQGYSVMTSRMRNERDISARAPARRTLWIADTVYGDEWLTEAYETGEIEPRPTGVPSC